VVHEVETLGTKTVSKYGVSTSARAFSANSAQQSINRSTGSSFRRLQADCGYWFKFVEPGLIFKRAHNTATWAHFRPTYYKHQASSNGLVHRDDGTIIRRVIKLARRVKQSTIW